MPYICTITIARTASVPAGSSQPPVQGAKADNLWRSDFASVAAWTRPVYVAFVLDAFAHRIMGWRSQCLQHEALNDRIRALVRANRCNESAFEELARQVGEIRSAPRLPSWACYSETRSFALPESESPRLCIELSKRSLTCIGRFTWPNEPSIE